MNLSGSEIYASTSDDDFCSDDSGSDKMDEDSSAQSSAVPAGQSASSGLSAASVDAQDELKVKRAKT